MRSVNFISMVDTFREHCSLRTCRPCSVSRPNIEISGSSLSSVSEFRKVSPEGGAWPRAGMGEEGEGDLVSGGAVSA